MEGHFCFSEKLVAKITAYFREKYGVALSPEEADQYLNSLGGLYRVMERSVSEGFRGSPSEEGGGFAPKARTPEPSASSYT
jgi:hypothetical protein